MRNRSALAAALLAIVGANAVAGTASLTWTAPTQNTDGTDIPATGPLSLASSRVEWFQCASAQSAWPASPSNATVPAPATAYTVTGLADGQLFCFRVRWANVAGTSSAYSNVGTKQIPVTTPNPPVLTVVQTTAYRMRQSVDGFEMVSLGTVPLGTECGTKSVDGYYIVPRSAVTLTSRFDTKPLLTFARCG